jgi:hypothetical protein
MALLVRKITIAGWLEGLGYFLPFSINGVVSTTAELNCFKVNILYPQSRYLIDT